MRIKAFAFLLSLAAVASCATDPVDGPPKVPHLPATSTVAKTQAPDSDSHPRPTDAAPKP